MISRTFHFRKMKILKFSKLDLSLRDETHPGSCHTSRVTTHVDAAGASLPAGFNARPASHAHPLKRARVKILSTARPNMPASCRTTKLRYSALLVIGLVGGSVPYLLSRGLDLAPDDVHHSTLVRLREETCESLAPLCEIDGSPLQKTLYKSHPTFYDFMLRRKEIEEAWSAHEYNVDKRKSKSVYSDRVHCKPSGHCDVATGGLYLCPPVVYGVLEVLRRLDVGKKFCVVGSGSLVLEAWALDATNLDVISFDLFNTEYQRRISETIRTMYDETRWLQVAGPFEENTVRARCGAIVFDTNIAGPLNRLHWAKLEETLTIENPYMWVQHNNWEDYAAYCSNVGCGFHHFGSTRVKDNECCPDNTVIPSNMHPAVLDAGNSWNEQYQFGRWQTFRLIEFKGAEFKTTADSARSMTLGTVVVNGKRLIRIDDYPFPSSMSIETQQTRLGRVLDILEAYAVPYLLGVSPMQMLLKGDVHQHVQFLNAHVRTGFVCMHGFDHRTDENTDLVDTEKWASGGEFSKYGTDQKLLQEKWSKGHDILMGINRYTTEHFIPPFNALTQSMVDVLTRNNVTFIHTCDVALRNRSVSAVPYENAGGNFGGWIEDYVVPSGVVFVVSEWKKTYDFVSDVDAYLRRNPKGSQVTLHWYYDTQRRNWARSYKKFAKYVRMRIA